MNREELDEMLNLKESGWTYKDIGEKYDMHHLKVYNLLKKHEEEKDKMGIFDKITKPNQINVPEPPPIEKSNKPQKPDKKEKDKMEIPLFYAYNEMDVRKLEFLAGIYDELKKLNELLEKNI
jgi:hypothetical protein